MVPLGVLVVVGVVWGAPAKPDVELAEAIVVRLLLLSCAFCEASTLTYPMDAAIECSGESIVVRLNSV